MGKDVDPERAVYYAQGIDIRIICFIPGLMEQIQKHIQAFFVIHNFGTRQDKGFGSFVIDKKDGETIRSRYSDILKDYGETEGFIAYEIGMQKCTDKTNILDNAYVLYQWMKSGINYGNTYRKALLTEYMLEKKIGGEKRWMKEEGIAPKVRSGEGNTKEEDDRKPSEKADECKYIRAIMGVSGSQSWFTSQQKGVDKKGNPSYSKKEISVSSEEIERYQSPITIKCIGNAMVFIAYDIRKDPWNSILDKEFEFASKSKKGKIKTLSEFNMNDFVDYCAKKIKGKVFNLRRNTYGFSISPIGGGR